MRQTTLRARRALLGLGALSMTMTLAVAPSTAQSQDPQGTNPTATKASATLSLRKVRHHVVSGRRVLVTGALRPGGRGKTVVLQRRSGKRYVTIDRDRTSGDGRFRLTWRARRPGSPRLRIVYRGDEFTAPARRRVGRVNIYRRAFASWYGPGFYGNRTACGRTLGYGTVGVAHKTLPCGTKVTLRYRGRTVRVRVIDRGPYAHGRDYDLTGATKRRLGFGSTGVVLSTK